MQRTAVNPWQWSLQFGFNHKEAVVLSVFGGAVGIGLALSASALAARALGLPFMIDLGVVALAFLFSAAVGVIFGFFPARRAASLNPIDALRHE